MNPFNKQQFIEEKKKEFDKKFGCEGLTFTSMYPEDIKQSLEQALNEGITQAVEEVRASLYKDDFLSNTGWKKLNKKIDQLLK